jgi:hypothetical protein
LLQEVETMQDRKARIALLILSALLLFSPLATGTALTDASSARALASQSKDPTGNSAPLASTADLWQAECVTCPPQIVGFGDRSLRLDRDDHPHIAYAGDCIYYAWHDGLAWQIEVVEDVRGAASYVSLSLDAADRPRLTYSDPASGDLKYAWNDGAGWHVEIVDSVGYVTDFGSLALDGAGRPHIGYRDLTNADVKYAWHDGTIWHVETVASLEPDETVPNLREDGANVSLALDAAGRPHMSYYDETNDNLNYAFRDGSGWHVEKVDRVGDVGRSNSLALDSSGRPHISYQRFNIFSVTDNSLKYARHDGSRWLVGTVATGVPIGHYTSLVLDAADLPHISYQEGSWGTGEVRYAWHDEESWHIEAVPDPARVGWSTSLVLDAEGRPHIAYLDYPDHDWRHLKYARYDGAAWQTEYVAIGRLQGAYPSLVLDAAGRPHVSYWEVGHPGLKYAWHDGSNWHSQWVDLQAREGRSTSLALDAAGRPHIAYQHVDGDGRLRYARYDGANWLVETVAGTSWWSRCASLALDSAGQPHISYSGDRFTLKHARYVGGEWDIQIVDTLGASVRATSLSLDSAGRPHTGYAVDDQVRYAWFDGLSWQVEVVMVTNQHIYLGEQLLALDAGDQPHLVFILEDTLHYARRDGTGWHVEIVDSDVSSSGPALVLDAAGRPHISYTCCGGGRYAWYDGAGWRSEYVAVMDRAGDTSLVLDASGQPQIAFSRIDPPAYWLKYARRAAPFLSLDKQSYPRIDVSSGETITYSLALHGPGLEVLLLDPLPAGVAYVAGSVTPPAIYNPTSNAIVWHGTLPTDTSQVVSFQVTLSLSGTPVANTAWLTDVASRVVVSSTAIVNARHHYLPLGWRYVP